jgi:hypothetical protein
MKPRWTENLVLDGEVLTESDGQPEIWRRSTGTHKSTQPRGREKVGFYIPQLWMTVITQGGDFEKSRLSVCAIHNALKYPDDTLLFLSDLRAIADGDHECYVRDGNEIG